MKQLGLQEKRGTHQKTASLRGAQWNLGWLPHSRVEPVVDGFPGTGTYTT